MAGLLDLFGNNQDERDTNYTLGLLSAAAGALGSGNTGQALGGALQGGLGFVNQLQNQRTLQQKLAQQKALQDSQIMLNQARVAKLGQEAMPKIIKDAAGYNRYASGPGMGQRVFPDVAREPSPNEVSSVAQFRTPNGKDVNAYFDKRARSWLYKDESGKETKLPFGSKKITPTSSGRELMLPKDVLKLRTEMSDIENGMGQITKYMKSVGETGQGLDLLANKWEGKIKTIFGKVPDARELKILEQQGRLQGLLGKFRKEIVGGGVMTEYDAYRVIQALGGEPDATRHPEIVRRLLREIVEQKINTYNTALLPMFNDQAGRSGVYKPRSELSIPGVFNKSLAGPPQIKTDADYGKLKPGEEYIDPNGVRRRKR